MAIELFCDGVQIVHVFYDLVDDAASSAVQRNQLLVAAMVTAR